MRPGNAGTSCHCDRHLSTTRSALRLPSTTRPSRLPSAPWSGSPATRGPRCSWGPRHEGPRAQLSQHDQQHLRGDGTFGHLITSTSPNDRLKIATNDGGALAAGKTVTVTATVWAYSSYTSDQARPLLRRERQQPNLDADRTYTPSGSGAARSPRPTPCRAAPCRRSAPTSATVARRSSCTSGSYNDHDDLIFRRSSSVAVRLPVRPVRRPSRGAGPGPPPSAGPRNSTYPGLTKVSLWLEGLGSVW